MIVLRAIGATMAVILIPMAAYWLFKWLSGVVSVPVLLAASAAFIFVCWKIGNRIDARRAREGSVDNP